MQLRKISIAIFLLNVLCIVGCDEKGYKAIVAPPEGLPLCLKPVAGASNVTYYSSRDAIERGIKSVNYKLEDGYPAERSLDFLEKKLLNDGFVRLKNQIGFPNSPSNALWQEDSSVKKGSRSIKLVEEWLNAKKETIFLVLSYKLPLTKKNNQNELFVSIVLHGEKSWKKDAVVCYIDLNPEEFKRITDKANSQESSLKNDTSKEN